MKNAKTLPILEFKKKKFIISIFLASNIAWRSLSALLAFYPILHITPINSQQIFQEISSTKQNKKVMYEMFNCI